MLCHPPLGVHFVPVDTASPDAELAEIAAEFDDEVARIESEPLLREAREVADLAEEMMRRGMATPESLEEAGVLTHEALDIAAEEDRLLEEVGRAFGLGLLKGQAFNLKVRRGMGGKFQDKPGAPKVLKGRGGHKSVVPHTPHADQHQPQGGLVHPARLEAKTPTDEQKAQGVRKVLKGVGGAVKDKEFKVFDTPEVPAKGTDPHQDSVGGERPAHMTTAQRAHDRARRGTTRKMIAAKGNKRLDAEARKLRKEARDEKDPEKKAKLIAKAEAADAAHADPKKVRAAGKKQVFGERATALNKRIKKAVTAGAKSGELDEKKGTPVAQHGEHGTELSQAEIHVNDAGRISQRTLLTFAEEECSQPTTTERYRNPDGSYVESRRALHERIIDGALRQRNDDGSISYTNPYLPPQEVPQVLFTGGGYAAGKGSIQRAIDAWGQTPPDAMLLDPDVLKAELPEFQDMIGDDPEANLVVYQEAWDIAQEIQERAKEKKLNVVVDGIANTSADEVKARVQGFKDAGYGDVRMVYVSVPTETAIQRATDRAQNAQKDSDRRMIPDVIMRAVHRDVSATIPGVIDGAGEMGATVEIWDTDVAWGEMPKLTAIAHPDGNSEVIDAQLFQEILDKANEGIKGLDKPKEGPAKPPKTTPKDSRVVGTRIDSAKEHEIGTRLNDLLANAADDDQKDPQPVSNPEELVALGKEKGLPEFKALMDEGGGISKALGAETYDMSAPGADFKAMAKKLHELRDQPAVIIGPVKKVERVRDKALGGEDASHITDVVRGTVLTPDTDMLGDAIQKIMDQVKAQGDGWKIDLVKNRLASDGGSKRFGGSGYGDISLIITSPTMSYELQVNTAPLWYQKEVSEGHKLYERERVILEKAEREGRDLTGEEQSTLKQLYAKAKPLYDHAWAVSMNLATPLAAGAAA